MGNHGRGAGWARRLLLASALIGGLAGSSALAFDSDLPLAGCEADAIAAGINPAGSVSWVGDRHAIGPWSFASHVRIVCGDDGCRARTGRMAVAVGPDGWDADDAASVFDRIAVEDSIWFDESASLLAAMANVTRAVFRIDGEDAEDIAVAMVGGWRETDGSRRLVFFDEGSVPGARITARTSIACAIDGSACEVDITTLIDGAPRQDPACPAEFSASGT